MGLNFFNFELQMICVMNCKKINKCMGNQQRNTYSNCIFQVSITVFNNFSTDFSIPMIIFKAFQGRENFQSKFQNFPYFSRICKNSATRTSTFDSLHTDDPEACGARQCSVPVKRRAPIHGTVALSDIRDGQRPVRSILVVGQQPHPGVNPDRYVVPVPADVRLLVAPRRAAQLHVIAGRKTHRQRRVRYVRSHWSTYHPTRSTPAEKPRDSPCYFKMF